MTLDLNLTADSKALLDRILRSDCYPTDDSDPHVLYLLPRLNTAERGNLTDLKGKGIILNTSELEPGFLYAYVSKDALNALNIEPAF